MEIFEQLKDVMFSNLLPVICLLSFRPFMASIILYRNGRERKHESRYQASRTEHSSSGNPGCRVGCRDIEPEHVCKIQCNIGRLSMLLIQTFVLST